MILNLDKDEKSDILNRIPRAFLAYYAQGKKS